jgi:hypothetical protein
MEITVYPTKGDQPLIDLRWESAVSLQASENQLRSVRRGERVLRLVPLGEPLTVGSWDFVTPKGDVERTSLEITVFTTTPSEPPPAFGCPEP